MFLAASYTILGTYLVYKNTNKMSPVHPEYNRDPLTNLKLQEIPGFYEFH